MKEDLPPEPENAQVKKLVRALQDAGLTPQAIAEAMENRVSKRTIYRWASGESSPGNTYDYEALEALVEKHC